MVVVVGHVIGLVVPKSWTSAVGLSEHAYHVQAVALGIVAGLTFVWRHPYLRTVLLVFGGGYFTYSYLAEPYRILGSPYGLNRVVASAA